MALVLIDTSAWLFNFPPRVVEPIRARITAVVQQNLAAIASPILFEVLSGARSEEDGTRLHRYLSSLHPIPFTDAQWGEAARWAQRLRAKGVQAKTMDLLIAYLAVTHHLVVLHADRDFDRMAAHTALTVESYVHAVRVSSR